MEENTLKTNTQNNGIFMLIIAVALIMLFPIISDVIKTKEIVVTDGKIITASIEQKIVRRGGKSFSLDLKYEYYINEKRYVGDKIGITRLWAGNKMFMEHLIKKYATGTTVSVYYNPNDLNDCLLERINITTVITIILLSLIIVACTFKLSRNFDANK